MKTNTNEQTRILKTKDYKLFKFLKGNRIIIKSKVENLVKSYANGTNLFPYNPIIINKDKYIIDGQHRLEACRQLKTEVYYVVVPDFTIQQVAEINSNQNRWTNNDFVNCYETLGKKDYTTLKEFKLKWELRFADAMAMLMYGSIAIYPKELLYPNFRNGKFEVKYFEKATKIMQSAFDYELLIEDCSSRPFVRAIELLSASSLYNHKEVVTKLKKNNLKLELKKNHKDYIYQIESLFNFHNSKREIIYK